MKKIILTLAAISMVLPVFALDNLSIDEKLKENITSIIKNSAEEQEVQQKQATTEKEIHPLLKLIRERMEITEQVIAKNIEHPFPAVIAPNYLEGQLQQQKAYQQMKEWNAAQQIFDYIEYNFYINKVQNPKVNCTFNGETKIEVKFIHYETAVTVTYRYNPEYKVGDPAPITHIFINK